MSDERDRTGAGDDRSGVARDSTDATERRGETGSDADRITDESDAARAPDETGPMTHEHERPSDRTETTTDSTTDAAADESNFRRVRRYVQYATLGALVLLGVIALIQFYFSASNAITTWIEPEYRNVFRMAFNLAVLLLVGAGISWQLRRMGTEE